MGSQTIEVSAVLPSKISVRFHFKDETLFGLLFSGGSMRRLLLSGNSLQEIQNDFQVYCSRNAITPTYLMLENPVTGFCVDSDQVARDPFSVFGGHF